MVRVTAPPRRHLFQRSVSLSPLLFHFPWLVSITCETGWCLWHIVTTFPALVHADDGKSSRCGSSAVAPTTVSGEPGTVAASRDPFPSNLLSAGVAGAAGVEGAAAGVSAGAVAAVVGGGCGGVTAVSAADVASAAALGGAVTAETLNEPWMMQPDFFGLSL